MNLRPIILMSALWSALVCQSLPTHGAPSQPISFPVDIPSQQGNSPSIECVVHLSPALAISALAFSPDEKSLAVGGYREVLLWDLVNGVLAKRLDVGQSSGLIHAVVFLRDGKTLAVGCGTPGNAGAVKLLDLASGKLVATFDEPKGMINCLAASSDGKLLAAADDAAAVHVWSLSDRKLAKTLTTHKGRVLGAAFSNDGKQLATGGSDKSFAVVDVATWQETIRYRTPAAVHGVAFSQDGKLVVGAVGGPDESAIRVGAANIDPKDTAPRKSATKVYSTGAGMPLDIVWPAKGANVFVACNDHAIRAYDGATGRMLRTYQGHADWVYGVASNAAGTKLASGGADGVVRLWNAAAAKPIATLAQLTPGGDSWIVITSQGCLNTSAPKQITWKGVPVGATKILTARYNNPELVRKALAADVSAPSAPPKDKAMPSKDSSDKKEKKDVPEKKTKKGN
jgi:WD40 repeat protein